DLAQPGARAREDVRNAKTVADLDQLTARDEHFAPLGEGGEREQDRGRVVVHDKRRLGSGELAQDRCDVVLARAARPGRKVVLEVRVSARGVADALERRGGEWSTAEVRVDDHAGRGQGSPQ